MKALITLAEFALADRLLKGGPLLRAPASANIDMLTGAASIMACAGLGFSFYALHLWLAKNFAPEIAAAITGGAFLGVAALIGLSAFAVICYRKKQFDKVRHDITGILEGLAKEADDRLAQPIREHPKSAAAAALVAGYLSGEHMQQRH